MGLTCFSHQTRNAAPAAINAARTYASEAKATPTEVSSILEQRIRGVQEESGLAETGRVLSVGCVYFRPVAPAVGTTTTTQRDQASIAARTRRM